MEGPQLPRDEAFCQIFEAFTTENNFKLVQEKKEDLYTENGRNLSPQCYSFSNKPEKDSNEKHRVTYKHF